MAIDSVHRAIWYLRRIRGTYISRRVERYIIEELEEDLFPHGFYNGLEDNTLDYVWDFVERVNAGEINIYKPLEERILERDEALKEEHIRLLREMVCPEHNPLQDEWDDDQPF